MGHTYGTQWSEELICDKLMEIVNVKKSHIMPTHSEMKSFYGNEALVNAVSKHGGTKYYANLLNLKIKKCESKLGDEYEELCKKHIENFGIKCIKMKPRYPYDILVEDSVKVDVKVSRIFHSINDTCFYTFNLEKKNPTCDIFICYCLNDNDEIIKTYIIPSSIVSGKKQLSIGINKSKYDKFINRWDIIKEYIAFFLEYVK